MTDIATIKQTARAMWAAGDYDAVVDNILPAGRAAAEALGAGPGDRILDVAAGTGNAAIAVAAGGATVVASDLTPELFEAGRRRAAAAGVELEWLEADAEALPFSDGEFDGAVSTFGVMFAPRQSVAAAELARVVRPGGRIAIAAWTPDGYIGDFFGVVAAQTGAPPPVEAPPTRWGTEEGARQLLGDAFDLTVEERVIEFRWPTFEDMAEEFSTRFGPLVTARARLEPEGRWPEFLGAWHDTVRRWSASETEVEIRGAYLLVSGVRR